MMNSLTLHIDGKPHHFYEARIQYSYQQLAHTFNCSIAPMRINKPVPIEFFLNDQLIFSGQVDEAETNTNSSSHALLITGRSKSANMIDSRITMDALYNLNVEQLLARLAQPFGLSVKSLVPNLPSIEEFQINAESPVENVAQLIREQGFMLIERNGTLTIENTAHASINDISLTTGTNIDSLNIKQAYNTLYHTIEVQGQWDQASARVITPDIESSRILVITSDQLQNSAACMSRANYERNLALSESLSVSTSIANVFTELAIDGLNRVIRVKDKAQDFSEMLVIKSLELSVSESSATTSLELARPFREQSHV